MTRRETPKMFGTDTILGADHSIAVAALTMAKGLQDDVRMIFGAGEQDPPGLQQVPLDGIVVMIAAFSLMWHTVIDLWQPLPIWQVARLIR